MFYHHILHLIVSYFKAINELQRLVSTSSLSIIAAESFYRDPVEALERLKVNSCLTEGNYFVVSIFLIRALIIVRGFTLLSLTRSFRRKDVAHKNIDITKMNI